MNKFNLPIIADAQGLSLTAALRQAVDQITDRYGKPWIVRDEEGAACRLERSAETTSLFQPIHEPHQHPFLEICVCLTGRCVILYEDSLLLLNEGDVCLIPPETIHCELTDTVGSYKALWLSADFKRTVTHVLFESGGQNACMIEGYQFESDYVCNHILHHLYIEMAHSKGAHQSFVKTYVLQLLLHTLRHVEEAEGKQAPGGGKWKDSIVHDVCEYVHKNYMRNIRMSEISHQLCVSSNHLNAIFKAITGKTIMRYIEEYKLDRAKQRLHGSVDSIQAIASQLGYYDQYHFSKMFKKETGCSPSQYRKMGNSL